MVFRFSDCQAGVGEQCSADHSVTGGPAPGDLRSQEDILQLRRVDVDP